MNYERTWSFDHYDINLFADDEDDIEGRFEIEAICQETGRRSYITNLNLVISEFIHAALGEDFGEVEDSTLILNVKGQLEILVEHSVKMLDDYDWVKRYLEPCLDMDRKAGEWEK